MLKKYEVMTIEDSVLGQEGAAQLVEKIKALISDLGGTVTKHDSWGKRKFSYQIGTKSEGFYEVILFELDSLKLQDFKTKMNYLNGLIRYLVTAQS